MVKEEEWKEKHKIMMKRVKIDIKVRILLQDHYARRHVVSLRYIE